MFHPLNSSGCLIKAVSRLFSTSPRCKDFLVNNYFNIEITTFILKSSTFDQITLSCQRLKILWNSRWLEKQSDVLNDLISDSMFSADYSENSIMEISDGPHKASEIVTRTRLKCHFHSYADKPAYVILINMLQNLKKILMRSNANAQYIQMLSNPNAKQRKCWAMQMLSMQMLSNANAKQCKC